MPLTSGISAADLAATIREAAGPRTAPRFALPPLQRRTNGDTRDTP